ncbi:MAG: helix-turn-helix domain-containing protein [Treponema sp.]|nr:helix-turn-helix domain-containing protein [Treponema sp.]
MFYLSAMTNIQSIRKAVAKNIRAFREEAGYTQETLAEKLGFSTSHIANIEGGKTGISDEILASLCNIFHKKPAEIYNEPDLNFSVDKELKLAINDSVKKVIQSSYQEITDEILRRVSSQLTVRGYSDRRRER